MKHRSKNVESLFELLTATLRNNVALTLFAEERPSLDVVESAPADRAGLTLSASSTRAPRGFVAPTLFDVTGQHPSPELDDVHESDDDDHVDVDASDRDGEDTKTTSSVARNFLSVTRRA